MTKCIPMAPNSKAMRMYSENTSLLPARFSPQCIGAVRLWPIFPEIFRIYISVYVYILSFFDTQMVTY